MRLENLATSVEAQNFANEVANELQPFLIDFFRGYRDRKIIKADGALIKQIKERLDLKPFEFRGKTSIQIHRPYSKYSLCYEVTCSITNDYGTVYRKANVFVGEIQTDTLTTLAIASTRKTDWNVQHILAVRERIEQAKKEISNMEDEIQGFTE